MLMYYDGKKAYLKYDIQVQQLHVSSKNVNKICFSGARFPGTLNLDINEISTNMVPYPGLQFLSSSINPVEYVKVKDVGLRNKLVGKVDNETHILFI